MKNIVFVYFVIFSVVAQEVCYELYRPNIEGLSSRSLEELDKLNRIEGQTAWLSKKLNKGEVSNTFYQVRIEKDFEQIEKAILRNDTIAVKTQLSALYSKVETAYLKILQYNKLQKALRDSYQLGITDLKLLASDHKVISHLVDMYAPKLNNLTDVSVLMREIDDEIYKEAQVLGKHFQRYEFYENSIAELSKAQFCSELCRNSIKELKREIGALSPSRINLVQDFIGGEKTITLLKVKKLFNGNIDALLISRKNELLNEGIELVKRIANRFYLLQRFVNYLAKNVSPKFKSVYRMLRSVFDERYIKYHAKGIERVINSDLSSSAKYNLMKKETERLTEDMFLVDFSRLNNEKSRRTWSEIKDYVGKKKGVDELNRMEAAEKIGKILGDPKKSNIKNSIRIISAMALIAGGSAYFTFESDDENEEHISNEELIEFLENQNIDLEQLESDGLDSVSIEEDGDVTVLVDHIAPLSKEMIELLSDTIQLYQQIDEKNDQDNQEETKNANLSDQ